MANLKSPNKLAPEKVRNVCILAHVDHGKTSIADSLLSLNGLVSKRSVGTTKFLDNRQDEQLRGITMKSSAVLLVDELTQEDDVDTNTPVILNLIDTPGHIDFSTEVTAAVRISDSAIIVVDVVEGVCAQTKDAIKHAYDEKLAMLLVVNKIDKLVLDLKLSSLEMFYSIIRAIEDCNAFIASLVHLELSSADEDKEVEEHTFAFSPELGNVIFASAIDGWGFTLEHIAKIYVNVLEGEDELSLTKKLWDFDCYVNSKSKKIVSGAIEKNKTNIFVQLVTSTFHFIYTNVVLNGNGDEIENVIKKFNVKNVPAYAQYGDPRTKLRVVLQAWRSLSRVLLRQCSFCLPSPAALAKDRFAHLVNKERYLLSPSGSQLADEVAEMLAKCSSEEKVVAYISKKIALEVSSVKPSEEEEPVKTYEIVAIARVFSGKISIGQELYILGPDCSPEDSDVSTVKKIVVSGLYILSGRKYDKVNSVAAGFICGIVGLDKVTWRTATLVDTLPMVPLIERPSVEPILCNVITPTSQIYFPKLVDSLKLLEQTDSGIRVSLNKSGEYMLLTTGEVHLEKCIEDLKEMLSCAPFEISPPIYSLRETIDPTGELQNFEFKLEFSDKTNLLIEATVLHLNQAVVDTLLEHVNLLKTIQNFEVPSSVDIWARYENNNLHKLEEKQFANESINKAVNRLKSNLKTSFTSSNYVWNPENVWSVSNLNRNNINLLINLTPNYTCNIFTNPDENDARVLFYNYIITGFKRITNAGPLCEEPLMNCAFIIKEFKLNGDYVTLPYGDAQQANTLTRNFQAFFRDVFIAQNPVLMEPMLSANIQTDAQGLGKLYSEVHKRYGKVIENLDLDENHRTFVVKAVVPAIESKGFANDIRRISSGGANPSLEFSTYQIVNADLKIESDDSDEEEEEVVETRTEKLQKLTRRRKGLPVNEQIILHAEKQRTLKK